MGWEWRIFMPLINDEEHHFPTSFDVEKRYDIYYVESDKIGVKQRYGEGDYEVKVMKEWTYFGGENYKKDIVPYRMGQKYTSYVAIQVQKERQKQVCYSNSGSFVFETSFVCAKNKWWKSMCWEGSPEIIFEAVQNYFELDGDWSKPSEKLPEDGIVCGYPKWVTII